MLCQKCGAEIPNESIFCPNCGLQISTKSIGNNENILSCEARISEIIQPKSKKSKLRLIFGIVAIVLIATISATSFFYFYPMREINTPQKFNEETSSKIQRDSAETIVVKYAQNLVNYYNNRTHGTGMLYTKDGKNEQCQNDRDEIEAFIYATSLAYIEKSIDSTQYNKLKSLLQEFKKLYEDILWIEVTEVKCCDAHGEIIHGFPASRSSTIKVRKMIQEFMDKYFE